MYVWIKEARMGERVREGGKLIHSPKTREKKTLLESPPTHHHHTPTDSSDAEPARLVRRQNSVLALSAVSDTFAWQEILMVLQEVFRYRRDDITGTDRAHG